jgi:hypothetical protein
MLGGTRKTEAVMASVMIAVAYWTAMTDAMLGGARRTEALLARDMIYSAYLTAMTGAMLRSVWAVKTVAAAVLSGSPTGEVMIRKASS